MWSTSVPSKPSEPAKSTSLSKCPVFPTNVLFFNFFHVVRSDDTRWENKDVDLKHDGLDLDTLIARLQDAEGVILGKQHTSTRTTEKHTNARFPTIVTSVACVMSSLGEETKMSNSDMTDLEPSCRQSTSEVHGGRPCITRSGPTSGGSRCQ